MPTLLSFEQPDAPAKSIAPLIELGAYELLWLQKGASFKTIAERFQENPNALPSDLVDLREADSTARRVLGLLREKGITQFGVRIHRAGEYPPKLRDAKHPLELLYYRGFWPLVETPCIAVVGARKPSPDGLKRTRAVVAALVEKGWTIVSGLATGVDTAAHHTAIERGGQTIAVIGTPISGVYPRENTALQERLTREFLVISQVPVLRYAQQTWQRNRLFFPERNITMSALTEATVIVEASNTSGTLIQARAAIQQRRKLFILDSCFRNPELTWPRRFEAKGAIRVKDASQLPEPPSVADQSRWPEPS